MTPYPTRREFLGVAGAALAAGALGAAAPAAPSNAAQLVAPKVARLGDSIIQFAEFAQLASTGGVHKLNRRARGAMTWVKMLFPAFNDDVWHYPADARGNRFMRGSNHGLAGDHTEYLNASNPGTLWRWTNEVAPMDPDLVVLSVGTNNINSSQPASQVQADLAVHIDQIARAAGKQLLLTTVRPRSCTGPYPWANPDCLSDPRYGVRRTVNAWITAQRVAGLTTLDVNQRLEDPTSRGGQGGNWLPAVAPPDGTHPGAAAAWAESISLLATLRSLIADGNVYGTDPAAPGNLLPNGAFTGTGGLLGPGVTGTCANGWSISRTAGDATAAASVAGESGASRQVLVITPGTVDSTFVLQTNPAAVPLAAVPAGSWLRFHLNQTAGAQPGWKSYNPRLFLRDASNVDTFQAAALEPLTGELMPNAYWSGWPATHPVQTTSRDAAARCSVLITVAGGASGSHVISFGNAHLRQVPDPRIAWNARS
jgi:lysophospholipase L1-like esterase